MPFDPDQPRDEHGRWTDTGAASAIQKAASDGVGIAFAPFRSTNVADIDQDNEIRSGSDYKLQQEMVKTAAEGLGIQIENKIDTWGGYVDSETGKATQEVSNIIHVNTTPEKAELLAAIIGKAAPEQQDSVLIGTHNPNGEGMEYTIKTGGFNKARQAIDSMKANGIQYFSINKNNGDIILLDTDNSISDNVINFVTDLKQKGLYENIEYSRTDAKFVTHESYDSIIAKNRGNTQTENGFDINSFIERTKQSYQAAKKKKLITSAFSSTL